VESRDGRQATAREGPSKNEIRKEIDDEEIGAEADGFSICDGCPQALIEDSRGKRTDLALGSQLRRDDYLM
jgi:hypothetical protein